VDFYHALDMRVTWWKRCLAVTNIPITASASARGLKASEGRSQRMISKHAKSSSQRRTRIGGEEAGYFVRNIARMQYGTFRKKGYFIGSGVIEAGWQTSHRLALQTIGHVLECPRCGKHPGIPLHSCQPTSGMLLEIPP